MSIIELIKPQQRLFVMDLVHEAGIDVSDWANFKGGAKRARNNPKYCYDWTFVGNDIIVLNIWYRSIIEDSNIVLLKSNLRETSRDELTKGIWKNRADKFDKIVREAYQRSKSVRVIINEGNQREGNSKTEKASVVKFRLLDPIPWSVTSYDDSSGQFVLTRGTLTIDQFDLDIETQTPLERHTVSTEVFNRCSKVRRIVLQRANGKCEFCGKEGFKTPSGELFLETHHIVPLSDGGEDTIYNVAAICPNHHRESHYGDNADIIRDTLIRRITKSINIK